MAEYIDREAALEIVAEWCPDDDGSVGKIGDLREILDEIESIPAADVAPVRHGRWEGRPSGVMVACSLCSQSYPSWRIFPANYCPNCGAKMNGKEQDE